MPFGIITFFARITFDNRLVRAAAGIPFRKILHQILLTNLYDPHLWDNINFSFTYIHFNSTLFPAWFLMAVASVLSIK